VHPTTNRRLAAVTVAVSVALLAAGTGYACDGKPSPKREFASFAMKSHHGFRHGVLSVTASYLGVDKSALKDALRSGKTIADVAPAGKTAAGLADAFAAALKTKLDAKVAASRVTQADADAFMAKVDPKLDAFAQKLWTKSWVGHDRHSFHKR
jgi:hypothetical protein